MQITAELEHYHDVYIYIYYMVKCSFTSSPSMYIYIYIGFMTWKSFAFSCVIFI